MAMKVRDLLDLLRDMDPEAEVRIASEADRRQYAVSAVALWALDEAFTRGQAVYLAEGVRLGHVPEVVGEQAWG